MVPARRSPMVQSAPVRGTRTYRETRLWRQAGLGKRQEGEARTRSRTTDSAYSSLKTAWAPLLAAGEGIPLVHHARHIGRFFAAVSILALAGAGNTQAQSKLEARYTVSLAGIPLGSGSWVIDIAPDQYTAVASGRTTGLVKLIADGSGSTGARGVFAGSKAMATSYV